MSKHTVFRLPKGASYKELIRQEEEIPSVSKHEVLIKVRAVTLNYRDIAISQGTYPFPVKENLVPCSDGAGDVVKVGEGVNGFEKGDKVISSFDIKNLYGPMKDWTSGQGGGIDGTLTQYITRPASAVVKVSPESPLSYAEMSALVCTGATVWNSFFGNAPLLPGHTVLLQGTGGVSITALIFAKAAGAKTIITSSSDEKLELVKSKYGPDHTINYKKTPDWAAKAMELTKGRGVDHILENGGSGTIKQSIEAITPGGVISCIGFLGVADQSNMPDVALLALGKGCVVRGINIGPKSMLEDLVRFVDNAKLRMPIEHEFDFTRDGVLAAYKHLESAQHVGKVAIRVD